MVASNISERKWCVNGESENGYNFEWFRLWMIFRWRSWNGFLLWLKVTIFSVVFLESVRELKFYFNVILFCFRLIELVIVRSCSLEALRRLILAHEGRKFRLYFISIGRVKYECLGYYLLWNFILFYNFRSFILFVI